MLRLEMTFGDHGTVMRVMQKRHFLIGGATLVLIIGWF